MIDTHSETMLTLSAAAREVPGRQSGRGVNVSTVWRWRLRGIHGVKLETILVGGTRMTSREAIRRFFERTTAVVDGVQLPSTVAQRKRASDSAERYLVSEGL